jgi:transmembrane sensor
MDRDSRLKDQIAGEAAEWFVRLQEGELAPSLRAEFTEWLLRSPDHLEEFLAISRVWGETQTASTSRFSTDQLIADALAQSEFRNVVALDSSRPAPEHRATHQDRSVSTRKVRYRLAATAAAACVLAALAWFVSSHWLSSTVIRTAIGEQRSVTLEDGSIVDINTNSELRVQFDEHERRLRLLRGEARFKVARNPAWPFVVSTQHARIRALGTLFNVRAEGGETAVAVIEGHVDVRELAQSSSTPQHITHIELKAGEQAAVNVAGRILPDAGPPFERAAEWTNRRLVFREEPLAVVVAEFNRYQRKPIRIEAPQLAGLRISGTFDANDPNSIIEYFQRFENVQVKRDADGIWLTVAARNPAP